MSRIFVPSRRILLEALVLFLVAASAGLSLNYTMVMKAFTGQNVVRVPQASPSEPDQQFPQPVDYEEIDGLLAAGDLLVDARDPHLYAEAHLPGAVSLPLGEVDQLLDQFSAKYPRDTALIIYCNGFGCPDSFDLGVRLLAEGYRSVKVYEGGFPEWRDRGRLLEPGGTP
jgi:rhodanese-related sulfurtransferase